MPPSRQRDRRAPISTSWEAGRKYGIVVDAGSSGSRIQIYSWLSHELARQQRKDQRLGLDVMPKVEKGVPEGDGWHSRVEPGISSFGPKPSKIDAYLKPLLEHAMSIIPASQVSSTPIFVLATAGMRLLPEDQQRAVLERTCRYIRSRYSFKLKDCAENVRIISGEEEGLFGWIAVNYLMDGFDHHLEGAGHHSASTYGFLDMGGASTQIAFEPSPSERLKHFDNLSNVVLRHLDGRTIEHPVFVTTWLGYGTNKARERYVDGAVDEFHKTNPASTDDKQVGKERVPHVIKDPCLPKSLLLSETKHKDYMLQGTGSFEQCVHLTSPLLNKNAPCLDEPCLFNGVHAPAIDFSVNRFIGISEYWYSTHDVFSMGGMYDFVAFEKSAIEFCGKEWSEIVRAHDEGLVYKPGLDLSRLELQCFKAAWIVNILHEGIGIPRIIDKGGKGDGGNPIKEALEKADEKGFADTTEQGLPSFQSIEQVGDVSISWTLGKMVLEVSQSVAEVDQQRQTWSQKLPDRWQKTFGTVTQPKPFAAVPVVLLLIAAWAFWARRRLNEKNYSRRGTVELPYALVGMEEGRTPNGSIYSSPGGSYFSNMWQRPSSSRFALLLNRWRRKLGSSHAASTLPISMDNPSRPRSLRHVQSSPTLFATAAFNADTSSTGEQEAYGDRLSLVQRQPFLRPSLSSSSLATMNRNTASRTRKHVGTKQEDFIALQPSPSNSSNEDNVQYHDPVQRSSTPTLRPNAKPGPRTPPTQFRRD